MPAPDPSDAKHRSEPAPSDRDLPELRRAERAVLYIRWAVMLAWLPILQHAAVPDRSLVYGVHLAVAAYTLATHLLVLRARSIRKVAFATMLGDATGVFAMCLVTGGLTSDVYPYFYLHVLTTAIRFDALETFAALVLDTLFSIGLYAWAQPSAALPRDLALGVFYLSVTAAIAGRQIVNLNVAADGPVVFTERIDRFRWGNKTLELPVAGVFEVRDGKITAHRDYFDYRTWLDATGIVLG